jgi:hypothetical protein
MIAGMAAAMGGLDALVFTGGIGERSAPIRARALQGMSFLGLAPRREPQRDCPRRYRDHRRRSTQPNVGHTGTHRAHKPAAHLKEHFVSWQRDGRVMAAQALMIRPIDRGWAVCLTDGRVLAQYHGVFARRLALRYLQRYVQRL